MAIRRSHRQKTAPAKTAPASNPPLSGPLALDAIASTAYELFLARGAEHGHDLDDWLQAERELLERRIAAQEGR